MRETLKPTRSSTAKQQYLERLQEEIEESLNDPRPGIPHEKVMEDMSRYVATKIRHHLATTRTL
jgi:hypothetical protein